jgi:AmmeMemoRadiSam system protein A
MPEFETDDELLNLKLGAFVTLHIHGRLRGCIGMIVPTGDPLWRVVRDMAIAAATQDKRFDPISVDELDEVDYEISVLSAPEKIDNWQDIELGRHGVIIRKGLRSGVFLPQVAVETGWDLEEFLSQLCYQKAGLPPDCYKKDNKAEISIFTAQIFNDIKNPTD